MNAHERLVEIAKEAILAVYNDNGATDAEKTASLAALSGQLEALVAEMQEKEKAEKEKADKAAKSEKVAASHR